MQQFFKIFVDIVLWRRGPQDLPRSTLFVALTLAAYVSVSAVQLAVMGERGASLWLFLLVDPLLLMGWVWATLLLFGHRERFAQTIAAVLGTATLLSLVLALPLQVLANLPGVGSPSLLGLLGLLLVAVFVAVVGRIMMLATETTMFTAVAVTLTYVLLMELIAGAVRSAGAGA